MTFTAASFSEAKKLAAAHKGKVFTFDGGEGWVSEAVWSPVCKRVVFRAHNPKTGGFC